MYPTYMPITIEHGIEIELTFAEEVRQVLRKMAPGDSFQVNSRIRRNHALVIAKREDIPVISKEMTDGTFRIWRIEK